LLPYIGCKIGLISKSLIRYEGTLYTIDTNESTIALSNVRSFGTEGRRAIEGQEIPPSNEVYEFIVFRASDIKDLYVSENPPVPQSQGPSPPVDPAIVNAVPQGQKMGYPPFSPYSYPYPGYLYPPYSGFASGQFPNQANPPNPTHTAVTKSPTPQLAPSIQPAPSQQQIPSQPLTQPLAQQPSSQPINQQSQISNQSSNSQATSDKPRAEKKIPTYAEVTEGENHSNYKSRGGFNQGGYHHTHHGNQGNQGNRYNNQGGHQGGYNQTSYNQGGHQGGHNQGGFNQGGYNQGGYNQGGHNQGGYNQGGYHHHHNNQGGSFQNYNQGGNKYQGNYSRGRGRGMPYRGRGGHQQNQPKLEEIDFSTLPTLDREKIHEELSHKETPDNHVEQSEAIDHKEEEEVVTKAYDKDKSFFDNLHVESEKKLEQRDLISQRKVDQETFGVERLNIHDKNRYTANRRNYNKKYMPHKNLS